jgi:predicted benzoate:H+ symporter BenE
MMTGTSWLIASSGAMPNGSLTLGITYRSAILKTFSTSGRAGSR